MPRGESSRRQKRQRDANPPPPPPDPTQMVDHHRSRLANLQQFSWHPMLWLDEECLAIYGWDQQVREHFESIGWSFLLRSPSPYLYREATLEFLASATLERMYSSMPGVPPTMGVSFWMNGAYRYMTLAEFNVVMGFHSQEEVQSLEYQQALCDKPEDWTHESMWGVITGLTVMPTIMRGTYLEAPLRICHKLLTGTMHARKESQSKVNQLDLFALYCMHQKIRCNPGASFLRAVRDFGTRPGGSIMVAPLISPLAEHWRCPGREAIPSHLSPEFIREPILHRMRLLFRSGTGYVVLSTMMDDVDADIDYMPSSQSTEGQQQQQPQQQQQQHMDLSAILRRMDEDRAFQMEQFLQLRSQVDGVSTMMGGLSLRVDELQQRIHRRFPSPAHSSSSSSDDQQPEQS